MTPPIYPRILLALLIGCGAGRRIGHDNVEGSVLKLLRVLDECPLSRDDDVPYDAVIDVCNRAAAARGASLELDDDGEWCIHFGPAPAPELKIER